MWASDCLEHGLQAVRLYRVASDPSSEFAARSALIDVLIMQGRLGEAQHQANFLDRIAEVTGERWHRVFFHHHSGSIAGAGEINEAIDHLRKALRFIHRRSREASLKHRIAEVLLDRSGNGDIAEANTLLAEALETATTLGTLPLEKQVRITIEQISATAKATYPSNLTQREVEIIQEITLGKTDQEIADTLFISMKTVSNHVGNILKKTETGNRTEAAAFALRHGIAKV